MNALRVLLQVVPVLAVLHCASATAQEAPAPWVDVVRSPVYFAVLVEDVDRSATWYRATFGLEPLDDALAEDDSWRIVNLKNDQLWVELIRDRRSKDVQRARGFFKVGFEVPDVDAVAERVAAATGERPRIVDDEAHGMRILQLRDPEGNVVQLFTLQSPGGD